MEVEVDPFPRQFDAGFVEHRPDGLDALDGMVVRITF